MTKMKTKLLIYPFCGCFLTSAAVAMTVWMGPQECNYDLCLVKPTNGCCPVGEMKKVTKLNFSKLSNDKVLDGLYIKTSVGDVKLAESDGTLTKLSRESTEVQEAVKNVLKSSTPSALLDKIVFKEDDVADTVTVKLNLNGGNFSDGTSGEKTMRIVRGGRLPTDNSVTRGDGAVLDGWNKSGTTGKVTTVSQNATDNETYNANWTCPDGLDMNLNGTCVAQDGNYMDTGGNTLSPGQLNCYHDGHNYCYYKFNVTLHDFPLSSDIPTGSEFNLSAGDLARGTGNEGTRLWCTGNACFEADNHTAFVSSIHWPTVNDKSSSPWTFRGYYLRPTSGDGVELITNHTTNKGEAFGEFFGSGIYPWHGTTVMSDSPVDNYGAAINLDLYGAWARDCETDKYLNPAGCLRTIYNSWNNVGGFSKGDVKYETACVSGMQLAAGTGETYNPTCVQDINNINILYDFVDQYGDSVTCNITGDDNVDITSCSPGETYSMLPADRFRSVCDNDGTLRYMQVNDGEWYRPSYQAMCSTNVFGTTKTAIVRGYVCDAVCNGRSHNDAPANGTCLEKPTPENPYMYPKPVDRDILFNSILTDAPIGNSGYRLGRLWGNYIEAHPEMTFPSNANDEYGNCWVIECNEGYGLWRDPNTGERSCKTEQEICVLENKPNCDLVGFSCPQTTNLTLPSGLSIEGPDQDGRNCMYTLSCAIAGSEEFTSAVTATNTGRNMITCSGDQCTSSWLQNILNQQSCFTCPGYNGADPSVSPTVPKQTGKTCAYNIYCNGRVSRPRLLKKQGSPVSCNKDTVVCTGNECTDGYGPYQSLYFLTTEFGKYVCESTQEGLNEAEETQCQDQGPTGWNTCPSVTGTNGVQVTYTEHPTNNQCTYTLTCSDQNSSLMYAEGEVDYTPVSSGTTTVTCTGMTGDTPCTTGAVSNKVDNYYCQVNTLQPGDSNEPGKEI